MKNNYKIWVLLLLSIQSLFIVTGCTKENSGQNQEPKTIVLDIESITKFGKLSIELRVTNSDLINPTHGTVDEKGNIYIVDSRACKIFRFSTDGKLLGKAGRKGNGPQEFGMAVKILKSDERLYVFDYQRPYVNVFNTELKFLEQKKFPQLMAPIDAAFVNKNEFLITSAPMQMNLKHKFFLFNRDGNMTAKYEKIEKYDPSKAFQGNRLNMSFPTLISYDPKTGNLWSAEMTSYKIEKYGKGFNKIKVLQGNIEFRMKDQNVARGQYKMKRPEDRPVFLKVIGGKIFYGYKFHDEILLDIIEDERIIRRLKSNKVRKFLSLIDESRFLVSFSGEESSVGIVRIIE